MCICLFVLLKYYTCAVSDLVLLPLNEITGVFFFFFSNELLKRINLTLIAVNVV